MSNSKSYVQKLTENIVQLNRDLDILKLKMNLLILFVLLLLVVLCILMVFIIVLTRNINIFIEYLKNTGISVQCQ